MTDVTILLTAAGGTMVPQAIRQLKESARHRVRVVAVDASANAIGGHFADAFHVVPLATAPQYVAAVLDVVAREGVTLVLPWSDEEALALARHRLSFSAHGATLACTAPETLGIMMDKAATFQRLEAHGIATPQWRLVDDDIALSAAVGEIAAAHGEAVVKPVRSRGGRDVYVIRPDSRAHLDLDEGRECHLTVAAFAALAPPVRSRLLPAMVMERLVPPAWDIDILCRDGEVLRAVPRRRVNPTGIPFRGGWVEDAPDLRALAAQVASAFALDWLYDIDVLTDRLGAPRVIEVNPRPSGSLAATVAAGVPLLDDLLSLALGQDLPPCALPHRRLVLPYTGAAPAVDLQTP